MKNKKSNLQASEMMYQTVVHEITKIDRIQKVKEELKTGPPQYIEEKTHLQAMEETKSERRIWQA